MAKTNIRIEADSDAEIEAQHADIQQTITDRLSALPDLHKFNPKLIQAAKQMPINIAVGKKYLETWAQDQLGQREPLRTVDNSSR